MDLQFTLKNQVINRVDRNTVVSSSRNYLYAKFTFLSEDWHAPVTVIFGKYSMVLDGENKCLMPWEVLENPGSFDVSAFCGDLQTANTVRVFVARSGYIQGETPEEPTPDVYTQLAGMVQDAIERAEAAEETAAGAEKFAAEAEKSAQTAANSVESIGNAVERAEAAANKAETSAAGIDTAVEDAQNAADRAEAAVSGIEADAAAATAAAAAATESQTAAAQSASSASADRVAAETAAQNAQQSAQTAVGSVASIGDSVQRAETAAEVAEVASGEATSAASTAIDCAKAASGYLDTVKADSQAAQQAATNAAASEAAAAQSAQTAQTAATSTAGSVESAAASATAAANSAGQAAQSVASIGNSVEQAQAAASTAATKASEAAQSAEAAQESADDIKGLVPIPTMDDNGKVMTVVDGRWMALEPGITDWEKVQLIVRAGLAPQYFPVGYEFTTHDNTNDTDIIWRVVGYDTIKAADESLSHTMILETKYVYQNLSGNQITFSFDAAEALYYAENGLEAGTYNFTLLAGYDTDYGGGKTYSFTLTQPVPKGGVIVFPWGYNTQAADAKISTYPSQTSTELIETVSVSDGANGTSLGTADGTSSNMNYAQRIRYGSNNYAQSAVRQWLNSAEVAGNVWTPQTVFDRPPAWASSYAGFMAGLPEDFVSVVQTANITCRTNSIFESDSLHGASFTTNQIYSLEDKFFLLSRPEIYGTWDSESYKDGEQLAYYQGLTDVERIKYDASGAARYVWTRSPQTLSTANVRIVHVSGSLDGYSAFNSYAVCPACIIA